MPRGRHSGANPQRPVRQQTTPNPHRRITGDLMDGREMFEPFTPADRQPDDDKNSED